jgi:hypothetical protein
MRHFPDLIDAYLEFTSGHEATPKLQKWSILSVIAGALERRLWIDRGYYTLFPNVFVIIVGKSGLLKKSTSTAIAVNLLREIKGIKLMSERLTAASLIKQLQLSGKVFYHEEKKIKQSPLFIYASELAVFLDEVFGSVKELLTTFYDCQPNDSNKPWIYDTKGSGVNKIYGPCLSMLGASTKAWLKKCIPAKEMEGGFSSRIIFVIENDAPKELVAWPELDAAKRDMRTQLIADLTEISQMAGPMAIDPAARAYFSKWYEFHMRNVVPNNFDPKFVGYYSRKGDHILKIAMLKAAAQGRMTILESDIRWAGVELESLEPDLRTTFEGVGDNPVGQLMYEIRSYIKARKEATQGEIFKAFARDLPGYQIKSILKDLVEMGDITVMTKYSEEMGCDVEVLTSKSAVFTL